MRVNQVSSVLVLSMAAFVVGCDDGGSDDGDAAGPGATSGNPGGPGAGGSGSGGSGSGAGMGGGATGVELVDATGWVGGDPESHDDDPLGIQGAWYGYGDGTSCPEQEGLNPCESGKCCISGHSVVDETFTAWGCGVGLALNATGGTASVKNAFTGNAAAFQLVIEGDTGGQPLRIGFTQAADTTGQVSPYVQILPLAAGTPATAAVSFEEAKYPGWCMGNPACDGLQGTPADPSKAYDIQVQIVGGEADTDYDFCITSMQAYP
jgi:hypothetical protein